MLKSEEAAMQEERERHEAERNEFVSKMIEQYNLHFRLYAKIGEIALLSDGEKPKQLSNIARNIVRELFDDEHGQAEFERKLNASMNDIMTRLRDQVPGLDEDAYGLAACIFANFNTSPICVLLNCPSSGAVYTRKSRLKNAIASSVAKDKDIFLKMLG